VRLFFLFFMLICAVFLQMTLLNFFPILGVKPDLVLIIVVYNAFLRGSREGAFIGFCGGIFEDLIIGNYIGMNALSLMAAGYLIGFTESKLYKDSSFIAAVLVWAGSFTAQVINYVLISFSNVYINPGVAFIHTIIPVATYTALLAPFFYRKFYRSNQEGWLYGKEI